MADIEQTGTAVWTGDLRGGKGTISTGSAVLRDAEYTFATRFQGAAGTNPDELIAAAHAACYSMSLGNVLSKKGYQVEGIETTAKVHLTPKEGGGFRISKSALQVRGRVPNIDAETFQNVAHEADQACPVSNLLRPGLQIELQATLV